MYDVKNSIPNHIKLFFVSIRVTVNRKPINLNQPLRICPILPYHNNKCVCVLCAELLELRPEGERDVQRVQHGAVLQFVLPAQGLGDAPPDVLRALGRHCGHRRRGLVARQETPPATAAAAAVVVIRSRSRHRFVVVVVGARRPVRKPSAIVGGRRGRRHAVVVFVA